MKIVLIGDSPLSVLVGRQLDNDLARQAHVNILHLTRDTSFIYAPQIVSLLGKQDFCSKDQLYRHIQCRKETIKQINFNDHRIITSSGTIDYDVLLLDLTPTYTAAEITKISSQVSRLINEIQAKINLGGNIRSRVTFVGRETMSWQVALALATDIAAFSSAIQRALSIQIQPPDNSKLKEFLVNNGVSAGKAIAPLPGLTIDTPSSPIISRVVRGALLDDKDNFILRDTLNPEGHPETIVINKSHRAQTNFLRVDQNLAVQIASNVERFLAGNRQRPIHYSRPSGILRGRHGEFAWINNFQSDYLWAKLISKLDFRFYRRITRLTH